MVEYSIDRNSKLSNMLSGLTKTSWCSPRVILAMAWASVCSSPKNSAETPRGTNFAFKSLPHKRNQWAKYACDWPRASFQVVNNVP